MCNYDETSEATRDCLFSIGSNRARKAPGKEENLTLHELIVKIGIELECEQLKVSAVATMENLANKNSLIKLRDLIHFTSEAGAKCHEYAEKRPTNGETLNSSSLLLVIPFRRVQSFRW
jgi:hypothetical protein